LGFFLFFDNAAAKKCTTLLNDKDVLYAWKERKGEDGADGTRTRAPFVVFSVCSSSKREPTRRTPWTMPLLCKNVVGGGGGEEAILRHLCAATTWTWKARDDDEVVVVFESGRPWFFTREGEETESSNVGD